MSDKDMTVVKDSFYTDVELILQKARDNAYRQINFIMVEAYWHIGKRIVEEEQRGEARAQYGSYLIQSLSKRLTETFGKGFTTTNLKMMRQFYHAFPNSHTLCDQLSWSHYRLIMRIENTQARLWYMEESVASNWSVRALERQINSFYYERILASKEKQPIIEEAVEKTKDLQLTAKDLIKDPYVLEFLDLKQNDGFYESDLESALLEKLQSFLLELGRGFAVHHRRYIEKYHTDKVRTFLEFILERYKKDGVKEIGSDKLSTLIKLSGIDRNDLKEAFTVDGTSVREGYFGLQREIYK